jgi:hypothetical protein
MDPGTNTATGKVLSGRSEVTVSLKPDVVLKPDDPDGGLPGGSEEDRSRIGSHESVTSFSLQDYDFIKGKVRLAFDVYTIFNEGVDPKSPSEDEPGLTLGQHEGNHGSDVINYLKHHHVPKFGGKVGMSEKEYGDAKEKFGGEMKIYLKGMEDYTRRRDKK